MSFSAASPAFNISSEYALSLLLALTEYGVRDFVVSPGSRSQALALAAAELERAGLIRLHVRIDERDAAFLALGLALGSSSNLLERVPAAVITTSGSAVANLMPAAVEASRTGVPMLLLTADRPESMRGTGANQTLHQQAAIFANYARHSYDVAVHDYAENPTQAAAYFAHNLMEIARFGPLHANIQFVEPLSGKHSSVEELEAKIHKIMPFIRSNEAGKQQKGGQTPRTSKMVSCGEKIGIGKSSVDDITHPGHCESSTSSVSPLPAAPLTHVFHPDECVMIAGVNADVPTVELAARAGVPVIAEVTSGARAWHSVPEYRRWLREGADGRLTCIVTGLPNLSRETWSFASREDVQLFAVSPAHCEYFSPMHRATRIDQVIFTPASVALDSVKADVSPDFLFSPADKGRLSRDSIVSLVWESSSSNDAIYMAASHMVRIADTCIGASPVSVYSHRGLAGIDGTIAAASGVALSRLSHTAATASHPPSDTVRATIARRPQAIPDSIETSIEHTNAQQSNSPILRLIIGDLAFAHDVGGLLHPECEKRPPMQIIVINDHGGSIFSGLEVADSEPDLYERVVSTPQSLHIQKIAEAYAWEHTYARTPQELSSLLAKRRTGIIEICLRE